MEENKASASDNGLTLTGGDEADGNVPRGADGNVPRGDTKEERSALELSKKDEDEKDEDEKDSERKNSEGLGESDRKNTSDVIEGDEGQKSQDVDEASGDGEVENANPPTPINSSSPIVDDPHEEKRLAAAENVKAITQQVGATPIGPIDTEEQDSHWDKAQWTEKITRGGYDEVSLRPKDKVASREGFLEASRTKHADAKENLLSSKAAAYLNKEEKQAKSEADREMAAIEARHKVEVANAEAKELLAEEKAKNIEAAAQAQKEQLEATAALKAAEAEADVQHRLDVRVAEAHKRAAGIRDGKDGKGGFFGLFKK